MANVARAASGTGTGNTLVVRQVKVFFQVYPGTGGTDAQRGIAGVPFNVTITTTGVTANGTTGADGSVDLSIPSGATANLEIFGTIYPITVRRSIEALSTVRGSQRRLSLLGYELGGIDGDVGPLTDNATLNLQADSDIDADGVFGTNTRNQLRTKFGE
jgi:hypothetical protein